ncbi:hydroxyacid dehydrogenase, partial [Candidatus Bathyarchaeota archaeon]|nr:hydroxyacid dehydrogenase [Candidatus Bathyarchaeota archaeon]
MEKKKLRVLIPEPIYFDALKRIFEPIAEVECGFSKPFTEAELIEKTRDVDAVVVSSREKITKKVIEAATRLKVIGKFGVGLDSIDIEAATRKGIPVIYTPGLNAEAVAEHAIALMFALSKKIPFLMKHMKAGGWKMPGFIGDDITGSTLGLIGLGNVGLAVAKKLVGFNLRILAYEVAHAEEKAASVGAELVDLETLLKASDIVSIHVPLTDETRHMISESELKLMKSTAYLINTARGPIVDEKALYKALKNGLIAGAGLDVFEEEPTKPYNPL